MSAEINRLYPEGLKYVAAERGKPRHDPPLRFAPRKQPTKSEDGSMTPKTITVDLDGDTTTKIVPHLFFDIENFLKMQVNHRYILSQQGAIVKWDNLKLIHEQKKTEIEAVALPFSTKDQKKLARLKELQGTVQDKMDALVAKAFNLYQLMQAPESRAEWDDIVADRCFSLGWLEPDGTASTVTRGQTWDELDKCKVAHLRLHTKSNASEANTHYMMVTVRKPDNMKFETFYKRIVEMDNLSVMLPCLKDEPDCPAEIVANNIKMGNVQMCNLLMRCTSTAIEDEYYAITEGIPTDPKKLVEHLTRIETKVERSLKATSTPKLETTRREGHQKSRKESRGTRPNATGKGSAELDNPIPRKKGGGKPKRHCQLCEEFGGASATHNTAQCKKWLPGGKHHNEWRGGHKAANINVHKDDSVNQLMAQQAEFQKKIVKMMKSSKKEKKRKRRARSDSGSSDSD